MTLLRSIITASLLAMCRFAAADIAWPVDSDWTALLAGSGVYYDSIDRIQPSLDLVGTPGGYSAGFWAFVENGDIRGSTTNDALMFRMRLGDSGENKKFSWSVLLDTDGNASTVEWDLQLVNSGNSSTVKLVQTLVGGPSLADITLASNEAWSDSSSDYYLWSPISGSTDYHLDLAISWEAFSSITGVTGMNQIRITLATSTAQNQINKDAPLDGSLSDPVGNVLSANIPEPAVATLLLGSGSGMILIRRLFGRKPAQS